MKLTSKGRYAVMALVDLARFDNINPVSLRDTGLIVSNLARSTRAITAYLPFDVNFILPFKLWAFYTYLTKLVKFRL